MIQANELRIGNWVMYDDGTKSTVCGVKYKDVGLYGFPQMLSQSVIMPIELSPEILERAGFVRNTFNEYQIPIDNKTLSCAPKKLYFSGDYLYLEEWRDGVKSTERDIITLWNKDVMKTFYLHQLQNLYFALTGTELNVQL